MEETPPPYPSVALYFSSLPRCNWHYAWHLTKYFCVHSHYSTLSRVSFIPPNHIRGIEKSFSHSCKHWLTRLVNHRRLLNLLLSVFHGNVLQFSYIPQYVNLALPNSSERRVTSHYAVLEIQFKRFISC